jgi:hypothetical protein
MSNAVDNSPKAVVALSAARELRTEIEILEAWHGPNAYSLFLRKHGRRPKPDEAATIGRLLGGRVRAEDGTLQPSLRNIDRETLRRIKKRRKVAARRYEHIFRLKTAIAALAENEVDPADVIGAGSCLLTAPEFVAQLDAALCWLNRFAEQWHGQPEKACTPSSKFLDGDKGQGRS